MNSGPWNAEKELKIKKKNQLRVWNADCVRRSLKLLMSFKIWVIEP